MGLGTKAYLVGAILTFYSSFAVALGLGEITLNSALNQPLDAEIELLHVRDLTEREILVGLASHDEFARAGVDRTYLLQNLKFNVDLGAADGPIIRVTSQKPVREPFINFLLSAQWPSGKLLREYTLLVDLPVFSGSKAAPVQGARREQPSRVQPTQTQRESAAPPPARVSTGPAYAGEEYGPVGANENLWSIASKVRPDSSVTVQQTMLALQRLNPEAFINGNINLLRRGQVLRVPEKAEIQSLSPRDAVNEVADQNRQWSQKTRPQEQSTAQLEGSKTFTPTRTESASPEGRVKLSSGESVSAADGGAGTAEEESGTRAVEGQLAATQEELDAASRENADLKSRLNAVDEQIETMEKLVEVTSAEMRALELAAQQTNEANIEPEAAPEAESEPAVAQDAADVATEQESSQQPAVPEQPNKPEISLVDKLISWVKDNMLYVAVGLGLLIAGIVLLVFMRRRDDGFDDEYDDDFSVDYENEYEPALVAAASDDDDAGASAGRRDAEYAADAELSTEAETEDVVGECDIHIAYGQYEQAEEKLYRALEREPTNIAMRLKLLEVFAAQSDLASFDNHFAKIHALGDQEAIDRATMLRESIDGAEPFDLTTQDTAQFERSLAGGYQNNDNDPDIAEFDSEASVDDEFAADDTLNFDFTPGDRPVVSAGPGASVTDDAKDLDFDLSDLDVSLDDYEDDTVVAVKGDDSAALHREIESSFDALEETFEIDGDEIGVSEGDYSVDSTTGSTSNDALGDLEFDIDDIDADLSFDDVELDLESDEFDGLGEDDTTRVVGNSFDLPEEDAPELTVRAPKASVGDTDSGFDFDESTFEFDNALPTARAETSSDGLDFDLDRDLESAIADESSTEVTGGAALEESDFGEFEFDGLDIDDQQIDGGEAAEFNLADDSELGLASNLAGAPLTGEADEDEPESIAEALSVAEAEQDDSGDDLGGFNLDGDADLDDLDKELDSLTSDFEGSLASADALMDEPITDFEDDFNFDEVGLSESAKTQKAAVAADTSIGDNDGDLSLDLDEERVASNDSPEDLASDQSRDFEIPDFDPENDDDSNLDFLSDNDETATKLDLARAYIDMGDADGAKDILDEIAEEGNEQQKHEAETLLSRLA